jgi:hypothetical protein
MQKKNHLEGKTLYGKTMSSGARSTNTFLAQMLLRR